MVAVGAQAADQAQFEHRQLDSPPLNSPVENATAFWDHFKSSFGERADEVLSDRLDPLDVLRRTSTSLSDGAAFREYPTKAGVGAISKSVVYSFREAFFDLPGMVWLKGRQDFFTDVLRNSIDSVGEESVSSKNVSYRAVEQSWWKDVSEKGGLRYGIRPFRSSPYAFLSFNLTDGNQSILMGHLRYRLNHFNEHDFDLEISVPIAPGLAVGIGSSYKFGGDEERSVGLTVTKALKHGGVLHFGAGVSQHPSLFASLTKAW
jgi:hypothetical protein